MKIANRIPEIGLAALTLFAPPGVSLLMNKRLRRKAARVAHFALVGAGVAAAVPVALYVICKTSPRKSTETN